MTTMKPVSFSHQSQLQGGRIPHVWCRDVELVASAASKVVATGGTQTELLAGVAPSAAQLQPHLRQATATRSERRLLQRPHHYIAITVSEATILQTRKFAIARNRQN
jgi:hypothetical protein